MTRTLVKTDHELKTAVVDELAWTPSVNADRIGVSVNAGAVTLSGQVETLPAKNAAVRAAVGVSGVVAVADEIDVKHDSGPRGDADIAGEATEAINRMYVPAGSVQATVQDQVITLSGTLVWEYQREIARRAMAVLPGVSGVVDTMTLKPQVMMTPDQARDRIAAALVRKARFDARQVSVAITGSRIELSGTVSSMAERREAGNVVWSTPGVTHVDNLLTVAP